MKKEYSWSTQKKSQIFWGVNLISQIKKFVKKENPSSLFLFYDSKLVKESKALLKDLGISKENSLSLRASEPQKSFEGFKGIIQKLQTKKVKLDRKSLIIAMGGGVIGDLVGFVASTYLRGIPYIQIPTTLLAQVDSSLGGKNGINLMNGKNLLGSVYQPQAVFIDLNYLKTLPNREILSGYGEILKYSMLSKKIDREFSRVLKKDNIGQGAPLKASSKEQEVRVKESHGNIGVERKEDSFTENPTYQSLGNLVSLCAQYKMDIVQKDEFDSEGLRARLNLGHTFGHALEAITDYQKFKHGEAVLWGLRFSLIVSYLKGFIGIKRFIKELDKLQYFLVPDLPKKVSPLQYYKLTLRDKKSEKEKLKMVLLKGSTQVVSGVLVSKKEFIKSYEILNKLDQALCVDL